MVAVCRDQASSADAAAADSVLEWKRALAAANAIRSVAQAAKLEDPDSKWITAQLTLHTESNKLLDQLARWLALGPTTAARLEANQSSMCIQALAKCMVALDKAVEGALACPPTEKVVDQQAALPVSPKVEPEAEAPDYTVPESDVYGDEDSRMEDAGDDPAGEEVMPDAPMPDAAHPTLTEVDLTDWCLRLLGSEPLCEIFEGLMVRNIKLAEEKHAEVVELTKSFGRSRNHWWKQLDQKKAATDLEHVKEIAATTLDTIDGAAMNVAVPEFHEDRSSS